MTKLMQWLSGLVAFLAVWLSLLSDSVVPLSEAAHNVLIPLPIYLLMAFACYSLAVIGYRVATFNDCKEAAEELQKQIKEAREDLTKKGMVFS